jgi:hypothetical protein
MTTGPARMAVSVFPFAGLRYPIFPSEKRSVSVVRPSDPVKIVTVSVPSTVRTTSNGHRVPAGNVVLMWTSWDSRVGAAARTEDAASDAMTSAAPRPAAGFRGR